MPCFAPRMARCSSAIAPKKQEVGSLAYLSRGVNSSMRPGKAGNEVIEIAPTIAAAMVRRNTKKLLDGTSGANPQARMPQGVNGPQIRMLLALFVSKVYCFFPRTAISRVNRRKSKW
jgi:hypothetical protein